MTQQERNMLIGVGTLAGVVLGGLVGFGIYYCVGNLRDRDNAIEALNTQLSKKEAERARLLQSKKRLDYLKTISLSERAVTPKGAPAGSDRYKRFLDALCHEHHLTLTKTIPDSRPQQNGSTGMSYATYMIDAKGSLNDVLRFQKQFYQTNFPHQIRRLALTRESGDTLKVVMEVQALVLRDAVSRDFLPAVPDQKLIFLDTVAALRRMPLGGGLALWALSPTGPKGQTRLASTITPERPYDDLVALKYDLFVGKKPPAPAGRVEAATAPGGLASLVGASAQPLPPKPDLDTLKFVEITSLTATTVGSQVSFNNLRTGDYERLPTEKNSEFRVRDTRGQTVKRVKVKSISRERGEVLLESDGKHYKARPGDNLHFVFRKENEMNEEQVKAFGENLASAPENP